MGAVAQEMEIPAGPFSGAIDATDPNESQLTRLFDALNMYVPDPIDGSAVVARHGMQGQTTQLGTVDARQGQGFFLHRRLDSTVDRFTFGGGKMYRWDGLTAYADITPVGINIDLTNPVFCATFNDEVLITDETNKPWIYTPSSGAAVTIEYNSALDEWSTKGGPVINKGFPFFIVKRVGQATLTAENGDVLQTESGLDLTTEPLTGVQNQITWGNALDPRTGYDQLNFDHVWQLTQTSSDILGALFADEDAMVFFRNEGIGFITGDVDDDFRTSSTRDAIDGVTFGTDAPAAVLNVGKKIWFLDLDGKVCRCSAGAAVVEELWYPMRRVVEEHIGTVANRANVSAYARGVYHPGYQLVLFTIWDRQTLYAFDGRTGQYVGTWQVAGGIHITAMGAMIDSTNRSAFLLLGTRATTFQTSDLGVVWRQKFPDDASQWLDQADAAVAVHAAFERAVETGWLVHKAAKAFRAITAVVSLIGDSVRHAVRFQYVVPGSGLSTAKTAQSSAVTGEKSTKDSIATARWGMGRNAQGGAIRVRVGATHSDNVQFGVHNLVVHAQVVQARPKAK